MAVVFSGGPAFSSAPWAELSRPAVEFRRRFATSCPWRLPRPKPRSPTPWFDLFKDDMLTELVRTALAQNFDLRIAAERVLQAREHLQIARSISSPGGASPEACRTAFRGRLRGPAANAPADRVGARDVGRLGAGRVGPRAPVERGGARAVSRDRRGSAWGDHDARRRRSVDLPSASVARPQLEIAHRTRDVAADGLRLTQLRRERGSRRRWTCGRPSNSSNRDRADRRARATDCQTENALSLLLGRPPGDVPRGRALDTFKAPPDRPGRCFPPRS